MSLATQLIKTFGKEYKVKRQKKEGAYVNGRWNPTSKVENFNILASVQPIDGNKLEMLKEGERASEMQMLYTTSKLMTVSEEKDVNADVVEIDSNDWQVHTVEKWHPMLDHYKCLVIKMNRQE